MQARIVNIFHCIRLVLTGQLLSCLQANLLFSWLHKTQSTGSVNYRAIEPILVVSKLLGIYSKKKNNGDMAVKLS